MKRTVNAYGYEAFSIVFELLPHPISKKVEEQFEEAFFFENAELLDNKIIPGNNTIIFYYTNSDAEKYFNKNYTDFSIIHNFTLKSENLHLIIAQK